MTTVVDLDEEGESMWCEMTEVWSEQPRHDRFVQHCFSIGRLAAAAGRYRAHLVLHPDDEIARRMQERVVFLSTRVLVSSRRLRAPSRLMHSPWFVLVVLLGAAVGAFLGLVHGSGR